MISGPLHSDFYSTFSDSNVTLLVNAALRASSNALDKHDESCGSNNSTFGFHLYWFLRHEFTLLSTKYPGTFRIVQRGNWFGLSVGRFELGFYKAGSSELEDIENCFPANTRGAPGIVQLELFEDHLNPSIDLTKADRFILAHQNNSSDGVCSLILGVPVRQPGSNKIEAWAHLHELWKIDRDQSFTAPVLYTAPQVPAEVPAEIVEELSLHKKTKISENTIDG